MASNVFFLLLQKRFDSYSQHYFWTVYRHIYLNMLIISYNSEKGFSHDIPWLRNSSQVQYTFKPLAWLGFWGVNQPCTAGNDRFHVARGLWPTALFVWRVVLGREVLAQLASVPLPLWPDGWGLFGPHQPGRLASRRLWRKRWRDGGVGGGLTEERSCWLSTLVLGQACCQLERRLPCSHHDLHVSVATGILVCTSRVNIIPS